MHLIYQVFYHFKISRLSSAEEEYVAEYLPIMEPLAVALDILQGDRNVSISPSNYCRFKKNIRGT